MRPRCGTDSFGPRHATYQPQTLEQLSTSVDRLEDHLLPLLDGGPRMPILGRAIAPSDSDRKHYRISQRRGTFTLGFQRTA